MSSLGDRMKQQYENRTRSYLPRRTYTIVRLDGKAFHTLLKRASRPFDHHFIWAMCRATDVVVREAQGALFAYVQSDEASILLADFEKENTEAWFDGNVQKIASVSASLMTEAFARSKALDRPWSDRPALFDSRVFTIPDPIEVENYFVWRQKDWTRNSVFMVARSYYSHKDLHGKSVSDMHEMLHEAGVNWALLKDHIKNGSIVYPDGRCEAAPVFTKEREALRVLIPRRWADIPEAPHE